MDDLLTRDGFRLLFAGPGGARSCQTLRRRKMRTMLEVNGYEIKPRADLEEADLRWTDLQEADLRWAKLQKADLQMADLRGADLREADLREANLRLAGLRLANLRLADLRWSNLRGANFREANLQGANFQGADLRGANLQGTGFAYIRKLDGYFVSACKGLIRIGCQEHTLEEWQSFSDTEIESMAVGALEWWRNYKQMVFDLHEKAKGV